MADWLVADSAQARHLSLVILDPCRNNPLANNLSAGSRSVVVGRRLAPPQVAVRNSLLVYATAAGSTAQDGVGSHSPFAEALLQYIATPATELRIMLGRVRDSVAKTTGEAQIPFTYGSLGGNKFYLAAGT